MDSGIDLQARYSHPPNFLSYCGPRAFGAVYDLYKTSQIEIWDLKKELEKFTIPMAYLRLIADSNGKEPFDYDVVESFWIGNSLLEKVGNDKIKELILHDLTKAGLKKNKAEELARNLPKSIFPNHLFHVLYVQFVTEKVKKHLGNFDNCHIGWGKVKWASEKYVGLEYFPLCMKAGQYFIGKGSKKVLKGFVKNPLVGDFVSVHWGTAIQKITERQVRNLQYYTNWNLKQINSIELKP